MQDDPRVDRRLEDRLLDFQPSRPDVTQAQRRMQLERAVDWITAVLITVGGLDNCCVDNRVSCGLPF